jgi:hypothetical protein
MNKSGNMIKLEVNNHATNLANKFSPHTTSHPDIHASNGILTYCPSVREGEDSSCLDRVDTVIGASNCFSIGKILMRRIGLMK